MSGMLLISQFSNYVIFNFWNYIANVCKGLPHQTIIQLSCDDVYIKCVAVFNALLEKGRGGGRCGVSKKCN